MAWARKQTKFGATSKYPKNGMSGIHISTTISQAHVFLSRFWYLKLYALTSIHDFGALDTFARSKRSPIGYEAFVKNLLSQGHTKEAISYVPRCDGPKRVELYVQCGEWKSAAREAKERGEKVKLE